MQPESEAMLGSWSCKYACVAGSELGSVCVAAKILVRPESELGSVRAAAKILVWPESEATLGSRSCKAPRAARS